MNRHVPLALLSGELDGELTPTEARSVAEHLEGCPGCRARRTGLAEARRALRELPRQDSAPIGLQSRLRVAKAADRVAQGGRAVGWTGWWRRLFPPALAGAGTWGMAALLLVLHSVPVRGFDDGAAARRRSETWQRLESYEALLSLDGQVIPASHASPVATARLERAVRGHQALSGSARSPRP